MEDIADSTAPPGVSPENPAGACYKIKLMFPYKKSGYYWVKSACQNEPKRVYCDFETE